MKKMLLVVALLAALTGSAWAEFTGTITEFQDYFADFATGVANVLPATASIGTWSPAYIGQFPNFGVGITAGGAFLPYDTMKATLDALGVTLPSEVAFMKDYGLPFPAIALDGRLGGFLFPFDLGLRVGFIPESARDMFGKVGVDYLMVGGDIRIPLLKDRGFVPALSVGAGYTYLRGAVAIPDALGVGDSVVNLSSLMGGGTYNLLATAPDLAFSWQTHAITAKVQLSKNLLIFTPHVGLGAAYGISQAGGGVQSAIQVDDDGTFDPITQAQIDAIKAAFVNAGYSEPDVSADGFLVKADANGYSLWVYGGTSINLFFLRLDLSGMYNLVGGGYGLSANLRVQF
jgi:hypothetical protein